jgi:hypothetical protein
MEGRSLDAASSCGAVLGYSVGVGFRVERGCIFSFLVAHVVKT